MAKVVQINLNHCQVAQDLLPKIVLEEKADIAIVSEQYRDLSNQNWVRDTTSKAAIWVCGDLHISKKMADPNPCFTWVEVAGIRIYSCYLPPSLTIEEFLRSLDSIATSTRASQLPVVIAGDFNAWATEWGSTKTNHRGQALLDVFATLEVEIANTGTRPPYAKAGKSSIIDLTFVDPRLMGDRLDWSVRDCYTGSDHFAIVYHLRRTARRPKNPRRGKWAPATFDCEAFRCTLDGVVVERPPEERARSLMRAITSAMPPCP